MLHAMCLECGLTHSRPSKDGNPCLLLCTRPSYFFQLLLVSLPHGNLRPIAQLRSCHVHMQTEGRPFVTMASGGLGDNSTTGQLLHTERTDTNPSA